MAVAEKNLKCLLATRAHIMEAKATVQEHILTQVPDVDVGAIQQELEEYRNVARQYGIHADDIENTQNDDVNF